MARHKYTPQDRELEKEITDSLKVTSYLDNIIDKLYEGKEIKNVVPDFSDGMNKSSNSNESSSLFSIDPKSSDTLFNVASGVVGPNGMAAAMTTVWPQETPYTTKIASSTPAVLNSKKVGISTRQYAALQKYPSLIEILGSDEGDKIAQSILWKVNEIMVDKISANSREINKNAQSCKADRHNIKHYFVGDNDEWVCIVTASGPFRGDEAFYYDKEKDDARILRKVDGEYADVTPHFNMIHETVTRE